MEMSDIELVSGSDETRAKEAFDKLHNLIQVELAKYLAHKISNPVDREEIISKSCLRIWNVRTKFLAESVGAWYQHIYRVCWWVAIDHLRSKQEHGTFEDHGILDTAFEEIDETSAESRRRLHDLADSVWLGWDRSVEPLERKRRVLAAQLFYLHSRNWAEIATVVRLRPDSDRAKFDDWISQKPTLLHLSFKELYATNKELCEILLGERPVLTGQGEPRYHQVNWTREQIEFIRYRFQYGVEPTHISPDLAEQTIAECLELFPFVDRFDRIEKQITKPNGAANLLNTVGLWKRIVFHYHAVNDLKYRQIQERVEPIATRVGQRMNSNTMQAWLSSGRLAQQLRDSL
jgi:DNA-directed RNA polymerase specialized sigma24 family protein